MSWFLQSLCLLASEVMLAGLKYYHTLSVILTAFGTIACDVHQPPQCGELLKYRLQ